MHAWYSQALNADLPMRRSEQMLLQQRMDLCQRYTGQLKVFTLGYKFFFLLNPERKEPSPPPAPT